MSLTRSVAFIPTSLLEAAGYSFHQGVADDRPELGPAAWWFCWAAGTDVECGRGCELFDEAVAEALVHWFENTHPMYTEFLKGLVAGEPETEPDFDNWLGSADEFEAAHMAWEIASSARDVLERHKVVLNLKE